jgi:hypothetical protein
MLREKLAEYANKNEELDTMLNEESDKLDLEIKKANSLLAENKQLKDTVMQADFELNERENEIVERDRYIDQLEGQIKNLEAEVTKKDMLIKNTNHTKNSRSLMNGAGLKIEKRQKNLSN